MQRLAGLSAGLKRQLGKKFALALGVLPLPIQPPVVVTACLCRHPDFMQRLLQIDDDLAPVGKGQRHHATHTLVVNICIAFIVHAITTFLHGFEQGFGLIQEFEVSHYNLSMLKAKQILATLIVLGACMLNLAGCGQTGPLYLPTPPATSTAK